MFVFYRFVCIYKHFPSDLKQEWHHWHFWLQLLFSFGSRVHKRQSGQIQKDFILYVVVETILLCFLDYCLTWRDKIAMDGWFDWKLNKRKGGLWHLLYIYIWFFKTTCTVVIWLIILWLGSVRRGISGKSRSASANVLILMVDINMAQMQRAGPKDLPQESSSV